MTSDSFSRLAAVLGAERFIVEIKTTAALQHPHILPLFDSGAADGFLYDVMPDGEHFLMLQVNPDAAPELRVIRNWAAELKATVGRN